MKPDVLMGLILVRTVVAEHVPVVLHARRKLTKPAVNTELIPARTVVAVRAPAAQAAVFRPVPAFLLNRRTALIQHLLAPIVPVLKQSTPAGNVIPVIINPALPVWLTVWPAVPLPAQVRLLPVLPTRFRRLPAKTVTGQPTIHAALKPAVRKA